MCAELKLKVKKTPKKISKTKYQFKKPTPWYLCHTRKKCEAIDKKFIIKKLGSKKFFKNIN